MSLVVKYFPKVTPELSERPINVIPPGVLNLALTDQGSTPTALSSAQLLFLREVEHTTSNYITVKEDGTGDKTSVYIACDLQNPYSGYAGLSYLNTPFGNGQTPATDTFHKVRRLDGLYFNDTASVGTPLTNVLSTGIASFIDDDLNTAYTPKPDTGFAEVGVRVGEVNGNLSYPATVQYVGVYCDTASASSVVIYKSNDNQTWERVVLSLADTNWINGSYTTTLWHGGAAGGSLFTYKFAAPESAVYFKAVIPLNATTLNFYEILAFNTSGECRVSDDDVYYTGVNPTNALASPYEFIWDTDQRAKAVQWFFSPITLSASGSGGSISLDHVEVYTKAESVGFGTDGKATEINIPYNTVSTINTAVIRYVTNIDSQNRVMKSVQVKVLISPLDVTSFSPAAGLSSTVTLTDSARNATLCREVLNAQKNARGSFGDNSITVNATGTAFVTETAGAPVGAGEYQVNYETGVITIITNTDGNEDIDFSYNNEGSTTTEISADGSTFVTAGNSITIPGEYAVGESASFWVRRNLINYSVNKIRRAFMVSTPQMEESEVAISS